MRISTTQFFTMNVQQMNDQQSALAQLYQQLSSGVSLATPSDNPLGAAQAVQLSMQGATLSQYADNQTTAASSLQAEDSTLGSVSSVLTNINTLIVHAGDGSLGNSDRSAIATQLQGLRSQLMTLANSTDSQGNYLFSGFQTTAAPYSVDASGSVIYTGDSGDRTVQVSDTRNISTADNGASVFQSVATAGTSSVPSGSTSNTGTGVIGAVTTTNAASATNSHTFSISFSSGTTYTVTDQSTTPPTVSPPQTFAAGSAIALGGGQSVAITGAPAAGDSFTVQPASQAGTDVFATIDQLVAALQTPVTGTTSTATLANALTTGMAKLTNTRNNVVTVQASVGGREQEIAALQTVTQTNSLQTQSNLLDLTTVNLTSIVSQYTMEQNALQAAQEGFAKIQNLSLFNYLN
ncbi:flagellar hook-associated protein FlgL [Paraburkholderia flava]|uniref:flagellar hook-associated protein FlgL n=1 Tax=Paraburkholderia flava TaxID=2547393 RepID=UPI00105B6274|nr:flagellar hook-associated protein FlgL [Paraburkholderia flava]